MAWRSAGTKVSLWCSPRWTWSSSRQGAHDRRVAQRLCRYRVSRRRLSGSGLRIALASTGDGNLGAAAVATQAIATRAPRALLFVEVAGALKDDIDLGDVVVAERIYAYHGGKEQDGRFLVRPRTFEASHELL